MKKNNKPAVEASAPAKTTSKSNTKKVAKTETPKAETPAEKKSKSKKSIKSEAERLNEILDAPVKKGKSKKAETPAPETPAPKSRKKVTDAKPEEPSEASAPVETPKKKRTPRKKVTESADQPTTEIVTAANGKTYKIDTVKHTCKRVATSFDELDLEALNMDEMPMEVYQKYMRERFPDEDAPIKKSKLFFKGFRISCNAEDGFIVEDTTKRYRIVELPFEGIPSPKELVDFLCSPKASADPKPEKVTKVEKSKKEEPEKPSVDLDDPVACRKAVKKELDRLAKKGEKIDIKKFVEIVPFKKWQRTVRKYYKMFTEKKVRYPKLVQMILDYTKEETFVDQPKTPKYKFTGTILPEFTKVGMLVGDKLEVDGKKVDAVPFLVDYILHYSPKAMAQMMRWAEGVITDIELLKNPYEADPFIEFNKKSFVQNKHNADILTALCPAVDLVAPQDMLYTDELQVGDKIMLWEDGHWTTKNITSTEEGIEYGRGIGVMKFDKWIKLPAKENK